MYRSIDSFNGQYIRCHLTIYCAFMALLVVLFKFQTEQGRFVENVVAISSLLWKVWAEIWVCNNEACCNINGLLNKWIAMSYLWNILLNCCVLSHLLFQKFGQTYIYVKKKIKCYGCIKLNIIQDIHKCTIFFHILKFNQP